MKRFGLRSRLAAIVTTCITCVCLLSLSSVIALANVGTFHEFPVPTAGSKPADIMVGSDGNLWFTEQAGNKIGEVSTK